MPIFSCNGETVYKSEKVISWWLSSLNNVSSSPLSENLITRLKTTFNRFRIANKRSAIFLVGTSHEYMFILLTKPGKYVIGANGRRYSQFAMKTRSEEQPRSAPQRISQRGRPRVGYVDEEGGSGSGEMSDSRTHRRGNQEERTWNGPKSSWSGPPDPTFAEHLNHLFPTLSFPPELARRILTHGSHPASVNGHNGALSFMGTWTLELKPCIGNSSLSNYRPKGS